MRNAKKSTVEASKREADVIEYRKLLPSHRKSRVEIFPPQIPNWYPRRGMIQGKEVRVAAALIRKQRSSTNM